MMPKNNLGESVLRTPPQNIMANLAYQLRRSPHSVPMTFAVTGGIAIAAMLVVGLIG